MEIDTDPAALVKTNGHRYTPSLVPSLRYPVQGSASYPGFSFPAFHTASDKSLGTRVVYYPNAHIIHSTGDNSIDSLGSRSSYMDWWVVQICYPTSSLSFLLPTVLTTTRRLRKQSTSSSLRRPFCRHPGPPREQRWHQKESRSRLSLLPWHVSYLVKALSHLGEGQCYLGLPSNAKVAIVLLIT